MSNEEYMTLLAEWQEKRCYKARNAIVLGVTKLVHQIANQFKKKNSHDDLFSEGIIGVMVACDTFKPEKGASFLTHIKHSIRYAILGFLRTDHVIPKGSASMHNHNLSFHAVPQTHSEVRKLADIANVPYKTAQKYAMVGRGSDFSHAEEVLTSDTTFDQVLQIEQAERLIESLKGMNQRDNQMLASYYFEEKTHLQVSADHDLSKQRVQQIIKSAVKQLGLSL